MTDYSLKKNKSRASDAFGTPLADTRADAKRPSPPGKSSLKRVLDKVARTISGREKAGW